MSNKMTIWGRIKRWLYWLKYVIARHVILSYVPRSQGVYVKAELVTPKSWQPLVDGDIIVWSIGAGVLRGWTAGYEIYWERSEA